MTSQLQTIRRASDQLQQYAGQSDLSKKTGYIVITADGGLSRRLQQFDFKTNDVDLGRRPSVAR
jgi:rRNA-processing protein FCF1